MGKHAECGKDDEGSVLKSASSDVELMSRGSSTQFSTPSKGNVGTPSSKVSPSPLVECVAEEPGVRFTAT